ncbi:MAG: phasin family protein, partial [Acetobacteraceae bacterium]|nr:phasin family protein [Acetobacteraceae bacterium]
AAGETRQAGERGGQAAQHSAEVAGLLASRAIEQGREGVRLGLRTVAEAQRPVAERGIAQGQQAIETAAGVSEAYRQAAERAAEDVQALAVSCTHFVRGAQQWQHAYFDMAQRALQRFGGRPQALLRAGSPVEAAQVQRDLYVEMVNSAVASGSTLLQLAGQVAQDIARPLQERARLHG